MFRRVQQMLLRVRGAGASHDNCQAIVMNLRGARANLRPAPVESASEALLPFEVQVDAQGCSPSALWTEVHNVFDIAVDSDDEDEGPTPAPGNLPLGAKWLSHTLATSVQGQTPRAILPHVALIGSAPPAPLLTKADSFALDCAGTRGLCGLRPALTTLGWLTVAQAAGAISTVRTLSLVVPPAFTESMYALVVRTVAHRQLPHAAVEIVSIRPPTSVLLSRTEEPGIDMRPWLAGDAPFGLAERKFDYEAANAAEAAEGKLENYCPCCGHCGHE